MISKRNEAYRGCQETRLCKQSEHDSLYAWSSHRLHFPHCLFYLIILLFEKNTAVQYWPPDGQINRVFGGNTGSTLLANPAFVCVQGSLLSHFIKDLLPLHLRLRLFLIVSTELTQTTARCSSQQQTQITINNKVTSCKQTW